MLEERRMTSKTSLSLKQIKALRLVNLGLSNQQIAERLSITVGTTKWHLHEIFHKLEVRSRTAAAAKARRRGII
jgi:LuxR family transcriptional regulator, maltose regulon positive regulatory protein